MKHRVSHSLSDAQARQLIDRAFDSYRQRFAQYHPELQWVNEKSAKIRFRVAAFHIDGRLSLEPGAVECDVDIPFVFRPLRKRALEIVDREVHAWLSPSTEESAEDP